MRALLGVPAVLLFLGCEPYPTDAQTVALKFCEATKALNFKEMQHYASDAYARKLASQGQGYEAALKMRRDDALNLQKNYSLISCEDLTLAEIPGRMMVIKSDNILLNGITLKEENRKWRVIE